MPHIRNCILNHKALKNIELLKITLVELADLSKRFGFSKLVDIFEADFPAIDSEIERLKETNNHRNNRLYLTLLIPD